MNSISGILAGGNNTVTQKTNNSMLGIDDFMALIAAQLQNQDMMNPMEDTDFIAQMTQFTVLEVMEAMNRTSMNTYAMTLVGKDVALMRPDQSGMLERVEGTVEKVVFNNGELSVIVDGQAVQLEQITEVLS